MLNYKIKILIKIENKHKYNNYFIVFLSSNFLNQMIVLNKFIN